MLIKSDPVGRLHQLPLNSVRSRTSGCSCSLLQATDKVPDKHWPLQTTLSRIYDAVPARLWLDPPVELHTRACASLACGQRSWCCQALPRVCTILPSAVKERPVLWISGRAHDNGASVDMILQAGWAASIL